MKIARYIYLLKGKATTQALQQLRLEKGKSYVKHLVKNSDCSLIHCGVGDQEIDVKVVNQWQAI